MSHPTQLGLDHLLLGASSMHTAPQSSQSGQTGQEWIPPPALLTTVNSDGIDLNDEIFFNYNPGPSYTPYADPYMGAQDVEALLLTLLLATLPYNALQLTITTPDLSLASPQKFDANLHYSHRRRFSSAVEQLNRMSLHPHKLELPTPDINVAMVEAMAALEERTINPRQLLGNNQNTVVGAASAGQNSAPASSRYILPSSVLSPSLLTFFSRAGEMAEMDYLGQEVVANGLSGLLGMSNMQDMPLSANSDELAGINPQNTYVMNDECVSAITYWLNNTENIILEKQDGVVLRNPTGIAKPNWKRRNSIQVIPNAPEMSPQRVIPTLKRKRRKSATTSIPEDVVPPQTFASSILPGMAYTPQFQPMPLLPSEDAPQHNTSSLTLEQETYRESGELLQGNRLGHDHTKSYILDSKTASRQPSLAEGDDEPKPFPCPECDKQFKRLEHLKRHIRSVHLNIRPFHCKYCDKKFLRSDNLAQHSKTHFKVNANGTTTIIYGNPNPHNRGGRKRSVSSDSNGGGQDS